MQLRWDARHPATISTSPQNARLSRTPGPVFVLRLFAMLQFHLFRLGAIRNPTSVCRDLPVSTLRAAGVVGRHPAFP